MKFLLDLLWNLWLIVGIIAGIGVLCYVIAHVNDGINGN